MNALLPDADTGADTIGARFVRAGLLTPQQVQRIIEHQRTTGGRFGDTAVSISYVRSDDVQRVIAEPYDSAIDLGPKPAVDDSLAIDHDHNAREDPAIREIRAEHSLILIPP